MLENHIMEAFDTAVQQSISKLGKIISRKRKEMQWTYKDLASYTGLSVSSLTALEKGRMKSAPSISMIFRLIRVLDISPNDFTSCFYWRDKDEN